MRLSPESETQAAKTSGVCVRAAVRSWAREVTGQALLGRTLPGLPRGGAVGQLLVRGSPGEATELRVSRPDAATQVCSSERDKCERGVLCACAIRLRELSLLSPEEDDGVLEGLDEFFTEEQVAVQKKKKSKKLKDSKAAKIKRRKKEVTLHVLTLGWGAPLSRGAEAGCSGH